jgi:hypothetical protein
MNNLFSSPSKIDEADGVQQREASIETLTVKGWRGEKFQSLLEKLSNGGG